MGNHPHLVALIGVDDVQARGERITDPRARRFRRMSRPDGIDQRRWFKGPVQETLSADPEEWIGPALLYDECVRPGGDFINQQPENADDVQAWLRHPRRARYSDLLVTGELTEHRHVVGIIPPYHSHEKLSDYNDDMLWLLSATGLLGDDASPRVIPLMEYTAENSPRLAALKGAIERNPTLAESPCGRRRDHDIEVIMGRTRAIANYATGWWDYDFKLAPLILRHMGFDFEPRDLKLFLYWYWG